jgi:hypothetical protein
MQETAQVRRFLRLIGHSDEKTFHCAASYRFCDVWTDSSGHLAFICPIGSIPGVVRDFRASSDPSKPLRWRGLHTRSVDS